MSSSLSRPHKNSEATLSQWLYHYSFASIYTFLISFRLTSLIPLLDGIMWLAAVQHHLLSDRGCFSSHKRSLLLDQTQKFQAASLSPASAPVIHLWCETCSAWEVWNLSAAVTVCYHDTLQSRHPDDAAYQTAQDKLTSALRATWHNHADGPTTII